MANYLDVLEGLPSDAFDTDFDLDGPLPVADHSDWPAHSSPAPAAAGGSEMDFYDHDGEEDFDHHDDFFDEEDFDAQYLVATDDDDDEEEEDDDNEEDDDEEEDDEDELQVEDENELRNEDVLGFLGEELEGWEDEHWDSDGSDSLFVGQGAGASRALRDFSVSLEDILSSVRRNHARALDLVEELHSEVHREHGLHLLGQNQQSRRGPGGENQAQNYLEQLRAMEEHRAQRAARDRHGNALFGDELVEVEMQPPRAPAGRNRPQPRPQPEVIDLTGESDSHDEPQIIGPPRPRGATPAQAPGRNPRRQGSRIQRTPSLSRSDGSILGNHANVIDLTLDDSPPAPPMPLPLPRRDNPDAQNPQRPHRHQHRHRSPPRQQPFALEEQQLPGFGARLAGFISRIDLVRQLGFARAHDVEVQFIGGLGGNMDNPLAGNIPNLNYRGNGQQAGAGAKPQHVPPPPARDGFTRDTGSGDDVVICPGCEKELKYDPDVARDDPAAARPAKRARNRKDQEEHYFWALKDCGHVYCKDCYEGRRAGAKAASAKAGTGPKFRRNAENPRKLLCAVGDCTTDAVNKTNWVGLFL